MIKMVVGLQGSGKTKTLIDEVNRASASSAGAVVCVEYGRKLSYNIGYDVRLVDAKDYGIKDECAFYGFVCGLLAGNFDIEKIFLLSFPKLGGFGSADNMQEFFAKLEAISQIHHVDFIMNVRGELATAPDFIKPYILN